MKRKIKIIFIMLAILISTSMIFAANLKHINWIETETEWSGTLADETGGVDDDINRSTGVISGNVTNIGGGFAIEDAVITLGAFATSTDENGNYIMILDVGTYTLTCEKDGYETYTQDNIVIEEDQITTINIQLQNLVVFLPPQYLIADFIDPNVLLTWNPPLRDLESYNIYKNGILAYNVTGLIFVDVTPPNGNYCYNVTAVYTDGESCFSNSANIAVCPNPGVIEGNVTLNGAQGIVEETLLQFDVFNFFPNNDGYFNTSSIAGNFDLNVSLNGYGTNFITDIEIVENQTTTVDLNLEILDIPENLNLSISENDIYLEWDMPDNLNDCNYVINNTSNNRNRTLSGFKIYRDNEMLAEITDPGVISYNDNSLEAGSYYYFITAVYDEIDESFPSNEESIDVELLPPQNLTLESQTPDILLEWEAPNYTRYFTGYRIYRNDNFFVELNDTTYIDVNVVTGTYSYYVTAMYGLHESEPSNVESIDHTSSIENTTIIVSKLIGNYPNPFNPETMISYQLQNKCELELTIYNLKGQKVKTLVNQQRDAGFYSIIWNGNDDSGKVVSSGVYFYELNINGISKQVRKCVLMK